jgi:hypothetical protein
MGGLPPGGFPFPGKSIAKSPYPPLVKEEKEGMEGKPSLVKVVDGVCHRDASFYISTLNVNVNVNFYVNKNDTAADGPFFKNALAATAFRRSAGAE